MKDSPVSLLDCRCWCCLLVAMKQRSALLLKGPSAGGDNAPHAAVPAPPLDFGAASPAPALPGNNQHMLPPRVRSLPEPMGSPPRSWAEGGSISRPQKAPPGQGQQLAKQRSASAFSALPGEVALPPLELWGDVWEGL